MNKTIVLFLVVIGMMISIQIMAQGSYDALADSSAKIMLEKIGKDLLSKDDSVQSSKISEIVAEYLSMRKEKEKKENQIKSMEEKANQLEKRINELDEKITQESKELIADIILDAIKVILLIIAIIVFWRWAIRKK